MGICRLKSNTSDVKAIVNLPEEDEMDHSAQSKRRNEQEPPTNEDVNIIQGQNKIRNGSLKPGEEDYDGGGLIEEEVLPKHFLGIQDEKGAMTASTRNISVMGGDLLLDDEEGEFDKKKRGDRKNVFIPKELNSKEKVEHRHAENYIQLSKNKLGSDFVFIITSLRHHFVFSNLTDFELYKYSKKRESLKHFFNREGIASKMFYCKLEPGEFVFKQGDDACSFFVIEQGEVEVIINNEVKRKLKSGDGFGDLALLYNAPRSASIRTLKPSFFWAIDRLLFRKAVQEITTKVYEENRNFIESIKFFQNLTTEQKDAIAQVLISQKFAPGGIIVSEGDQASSFYIIMEGEVEVFKAGKVVRKLKPGDSFGEQALYTANAVRLMTVKAAGESRLLGLARTTITSILGDQVQVIVFKNLQRWGFERSVLLSKLPKFQQEKIIDNMKYINCQKDQVILKSGVQTDKKIIIPVEGYLRLVNSDKIFLDKGQAWGVESLMETSEPRKLPDDVVMKDDGVLSIIEKSDFERILGGKFEEILKNSEKSHEKKLFGYENSKRDTTQVNLEDLVLIRPLGHGQFGSVFLVKSTKYTKSLYAIKAIPNLLIKEAGLEKHVEEERVVLQKMNFPFIISFMNDLKDEYFTYFVTEFIKGLELFDVIRDIGLLSTSDSQFYVGSLILALEYLHHQNIIYRDLKPENVMIDSQGMLKLIDMGTAKIIKPAGRTYTIIGTPHYMAPEIIAGKGYNQFVDLWSLGVVLYEFMCGFVPYGEDITDPYSIYEEIIKKKDLTYPGYFKDKLAKKVIQQLLSKVPELRLGGSYATLKANPWFEKFDWDKLIDGDVKAPYIIPAEKMVSNAEIDEIFEKRVLFMNHAKAHKNGFMPNEGHE